MVQASTTVTTFTIENPRTFWFSAQFFEEIFVQESRQNTASRFSQAR
jgi:hypothetical protein